MPKVNLHDHRDEGLRPKGDFLQDLDYVRTLPLRQSSGQFLSRYAPRRLCDGLRRVTVRHGEDHRGEGGGLLAWQRACLRGCFIRCDQSNRPDSVLYVAEPLPSTNGVSLQIEWEYGQVGKFFRFEHREQEGAATVQFDLETGPVSFLVPLGFLTPERALAEALFLNGQP